MAITIIERPYNIAFSRNPIRYGLLTDSDLNTPGLLMEVEILHRPFVDEIVAFRTIVRLTLIPDSNKRAYIDLQRIMDSLVEYELPTFTVGVTKAYRQLGEYFIKYREVTVADPNTVWADEDRTNFVIKGGLPYERWNGPNFFVNDIPGKNYLTWQRTGRLTGKQEAAWISYFHMDEPVNNVHANFTAYFADESPDAEIVFAFPVATIKKYSLFRILINPDQLFGYYMALSKKIHFFELRIYAGNQPLTGSFSFYIDYTKDYFTEQLNYFNSLGNFESLRILGEVERLSDTGREFAESNPGAGYFNETNLPAQDITLQILEKVICKCNTGWIDNNSDADLLRGLLLSKGVFTHLNKKWLPVNILNKQTEFGFLSGFLRNIPLEWSYAFTNEDFAPSSASLEILRVCPIPEFPTIEREGNDLIVSWNTATEHESYVIELNYNGPPLKKQILFAVGTQVLAKDWGYRLPVSIRMQANCGSNYSQWTELRTYFIIDTEL